MKMCFEVKKPERELSVGEILSQSFRLYSTRLAHFYTVFLVAELASTGYGQIVNYFFPLSAVPEFTGSPEDILKQFSEWFPPFITALIVIFVLTFIVTWTINTIANGVAVKYTSDFLEKGDARLQDELSFSISRLHYLLAVGAITSILIVIGLFLLVVPGIILAIIFALVVQAVVIERIGVLESLGRSRQLVRGRWEKTFVIFLLVGIIILLVGIAAVWVSSCMHAFGFMSWVITSVMMASVLPILPIATTFLYYSLAAKETQPAQPTPLSPRVIPASTTRFCPQCGQKISLDTKYCSHCGKEIEKPR